MKLTLHYYYYNGIRFIIPLSSCCAPFIWVHNMFLFVSDVLMVQEIKLKNLCFIHVHVIFMYGSFFLLSFDLYI
ncbi:hypothetical protein Lalb_Chr22g0351601 [Lupinus albus]|uniref:Uncharacterized protein n=1 Tax=Lupinus albus TaxID=3870 RepID=A0A6A4NGY8_LUPAL|nr:hypothetical protein Lalb_Chr22g0351601 [Lupinus albus]